MLYGERTIKSVALTWAIARLYSCKRPSKTHPGARNASFFVLGRQEKALMAFSWYALDNNTRSSDEVERSCNAAPVSCYYESTLPGGSAHCAPRRKATTQSSAESAAARHATARPPASAAACGHCRWRGRFAVHPAELYA